MKVRIYLMGVLSVVSLILFGASGQALLADGRCVRFLHLPFTNFSIGLPYYLPRAFLVTFVISMGAEAVSLFQWWRVGRRGQHI